MDYLRPTLFFSINKSIDKFKYEIHNTVEKKPIIKNENNSVTIFVNPKTYNYKYLETENSFFVCSWLPYL